MMPTSFYSVSAFSMCKDMNYFLAEKRKTRAWYETSAIRYESFLLYLFIDILANFEYYTSSNHRPNRNLGQDS